MGGEKSSGTTVQTVKQTPEERQLNRLELRKTRAAHSRMVRAQRSGLNLVNQLLTGNLNLPGFLGEVGAGISPEVTQGIVSQSLEDIAPQFQQSGILDSGVAASIGARTAADIRRASEEFNIGNKLNLLNLALSGQAQVQSPVLSQAASLGGRLAGLRSTTGSMTQTTPNPFLASLSQAPGKFIGGLGGTEAAGKFFFNT